MLKPHAYFYTQLPDLNAIEQRISMLAGRGRTRPDETTQSSKLSLILWVTNSTNSTKRNHSFSFSSEFEFSQSPLTGGSKSYRKKREEKEEEEEME